VSHRTRLDFFTSADCVPCTHPPMRRFKNPLDGEIVVDDVVHGRTWCKLPPRVWNVYVIDNLDPGTEYFWVKAHTTANAVNTP
jgi:hypothetical protein